MFVLDWVVLVSFYVVHTSSPFLSGGTNMFVHLQRIGYRFFSFSSATFPFSFPPLRIVSFDLTAGSLLAVGTIMLGPYVLISALPVLG